MGLGLLGICGDRPFWDRSKVFTNQKSHTHTHTWNFELGFSVS